MGLEDVPEGFYYLLAVGHPSKEVFRYMADLVENESIGLVVIAFIGFVLEGEAEVSRDVLGFFKRHIDPLRRIGATPFLIDHQAKTVKGERYSDKSDFGSVYKTSSVRSSLQVQGDWFDDSDTATLRHKKANMGPKAEDFAARPTFGPDMVRVESIEVPQTMDRQPASKKQVIAALSEGGPDTAEGLAPKTGLGLQAARNAITELFKEGLVEDTGEKEGRSRVLSLVTHYSPYRGQVMSNEDDPDLEGAA